MSNFSIRKKGQSITVQTTPGVTAIDADQSIGKAVSEDVGIYNPGPRTIHVLSGGPEVKGQVDTTCMPVAPGMWYYNKAGDTHLGHVAVGGDQAILVFTGRGS